ncbi:MAG: hypothetical protein J6Q05_02885 [Elusimicrobiaceae bacterium]|nr:hypothetical protein [Elusimicrobiaceae bacterium]
MKYTLYILTMLLLFAGGMIVGNVYLPDHSTVRAAAVAVPELDTHNPIFSHTDRTIAERELGILSQALQSCPVVVNEEKDRLVNHIKLWLALEDFHLKKAILELEMAKNVESNRPTSQFLQAAEDYNTARAYAEQMADELFPPKAEETTPTETATPAETPNQQINL